MKKHLMVAALAFVLPHMASAAPITFFGENLSPGGGVSGDPLTQRNAFVSALALGVGIEDFESPTALPNIDFPVSSGTVTASLTGSGTSIVGSPTIGAYATSGSNYVLTGGGGDFTVTFNSAISAFGFYATDLGDFGNSLKLRLGLSGGGTLDLPVNHSTGSGGSTSGRLTFFGFLDLTDTYTSVAFLNEPGGTDQFGFDDMIVGDRQQIINPPAIPLPAAGWMLIAGLGGLGLLRRKQSRRG